MTQHFAQIRCPSVSKAAIENMFRSRTRHSFPAKARFGKTGKVSGFIFEMKKYLNVSTSKQSKSGQVISFSRDGVKNI